MSMITAFVQEFTGGRHGFAPSDFEHTLQLLTGENEAVAAATCSNNRNIILAALRLAVEAERDYADMRAMQAKFIAADQERIALKEALRPFAEPPRYVFDADVRYVPTRQPEDWIGGGWVSTEDFKRARALLDDRPPETHDGED